MLRASDARNVTHFDRHGRAPATPRLCDNVDGCGEPGARPMGRSALGLIAMVAVGALAIGLIMSDSAPAGAGGAPGGGSRGAWGGGFRAGGASRHSTVPRGTLMLGHGGIRRHGRTVAQPYAGLDDR